LNFEDFSLKNCNIDKNISNKIALAKYNFFNNDVGLHFILNGNINDLNGKKSLNAEIRWKILKNGYLNNKYNSYITKNNEIIRQMKTENDKLYYYDYNFIIYFFNQRKIKLLTQYINYLKLKFKIYKQRYFLHNELLEKLLLIKENIRRSENLINEYKLFNRYIVCKKELKGEVPVFDIDYQKVRDYIRENNITLQRKILTQNVDYKYNRLNDITFDIYANKELLKSQGETFGFNLDIPFTKNPTELNKINKLKVNNDIEKEISKKFLYLNKNYYTFRYKKDDLIKMKYKLAYTIKQLQRAKLRYNFKIGTDNLDRIISNIDSILSIKLQILDVEQQLLLQLYSLFFNLNIPFKNKFVKRIHIDTTIHLRDGNRGLIIYANGFKKYKNNLLIQFLKVKEIKSVYISISKYQNFQKLDKFIELLNKNHIKVYFLVFASQFKYYLKNNAQRYKHIIIFLDKTLNIENENVILPFSYKDNGIINSNPNKLFIYVNKKLEFNKLKFLNKKNLYFIFNAKNYNNELELELAISDFIQKTDFHNIIIDNLKSYIKVSQ